MGLKGFELELITPRKQNSRPNPQTSVFTLVEQLGGILDPDAVQTQGCNT